METLSQPLEISQIPVSTPFLWNDKTQKISVELLNSVELINIERIEISESLYWEKYYEDTPYEWDNGVLEEKPVSDALALDMHSWITEVLTHYNKVNHSYRMMTLEMGFRMKIPSNIMGTDDDYVVIHKPDIGLVSNANVVALKDLDIKYSGTVDVCIEILSDCNRQNIERDTVTKKRNYSLGGVQEYFILDAKNNYTRLYRLNKSGEYVDIKPINGVIKSKVFNGLQFRVNDLYRRPSLEEMSEDNVYKKFILPFYQEEKQKVKQEKQKVKQEKQKVKQEKQKVRQEKQKVKQEKQKVKYEQQRAKQAEQREKHEKERADQERQKVTQAKENIKHKQEQIEYLLEKLNKAGIDV